MVWHMLCDPPVENPWYRLCNVSTNHSGDLAGWVWGRPHPDGQTVNLFIHVDYISGWMLGGGGGELGVKHWNPCWIWMNMMMALLILCNDLCHMHIYSHNVSLLSFQTLKRFPLREPRDNLQTRERWVADTVSKSNTFKDKTNYNWGQYMVDLK